MQSYRSFLTVNSVLLLIASGVIPPRARAQTCTVDDVSCGSPPCCSQPADPACPASGPVAYEYDPGDFIVLQGFVNPSTTTPYGRGQNAAVAIDDPVDNDPARFIVIWQTDFFRNSTSGVPTYNLVAASGFAADGDCVAGPKILSKVFINDSPVLDNASLVPSVAMSSDARVRVGWLLRLFAAVAENSPPEHSTSDGTIRVVDFDFDDTPSTWPTICACTDEFGGLGHMSPSVGTSNVGASAEKIAWAGGDYDEGGLFHADDIDVDQTFLRACYFNNDPDPDVSVCGARSSQWQPCLSMSSLRHLNGSANPTEGYYCVAWCEPAQEQQVDSPFDVSVQLFDPQGNEIGISIEVNNPSSQSCKMRIRPDNCG